MCMRDVIPNTYCWTRLEIGWIVEMKSSLTLMG